jgi:hypothetical protein
MSYRNAVYCNETLTQEAGKIAGKYCGTRWCLACNAIRTARAWNTYQPVLETWSDRQLVTLTIRNVTGPELDATIDELLKAATRVKDSLRKTDGVKLVAIRKLECTYNDKRDDYHPHLHFVVENRRMAELLVSRWLEQFSDRADSKAQDIRPATAGSAGELFKYFTKLVTKEKMMPALALDVIFRALRGHRVYQNVGFTKPPIAEDEEAELLLDKGTPAPTRPTETIAWEWVQSASDWIDASTGDCLTGYEPGERFRRFVESVSKSATNDDPPGEIQLAGQKRPPRIAAVARTRFEEGLEYPAAEACLSPIAERHAVLLELRGMLS